MKILGRVLLNLLLVAVAVVSLNRGLGQAQSAEPNISQGEEVKRGEIPWSVYVNTLGWRCGATLIDWEWILIAAHCLRPGQAQTASISHIGGINKLAAEEGEVIVGSLEVYSHPEYSPTTHINDIGLIRIPRIVEGTPFISPLMLYTGTIEPVTSAVIMTATISGWGQIEDQSYPTMLRSAVAYYICRHTELHHLKCQDPYTPGIGICVGDSGIGLVSDTPDGKRLRGVGWGGNQCDAERRFSEYVLLTEENIAWIQAKMKQPFVSQELAHSYLPFASD